MGAAQTKRTISRKAAGRKKKISPAAPSHASIALPSGSCAAKTADSKGRVMLGARFANRAVIVQWLNETEMVVKLARVIPESEAWLYENQDALGAVRMGLAQARQNQVTPGPDVDADADLARQLED